MDVSNLFGEAGVNNQYTLIGCVGGYYTVYYSRFRLGIGIVGLGIVGLGF